MFFLLSTGSALLDLPDLHSFQGSNILTMISSFVSYLVSIFSTITDVVFQFCQLLGDINRYLCQMCTDIESGSISSLPVSQAIGTYRYLVDDVFFYLTYMSIIIGCGFTIYKLVILIIQHIKPVFSGSSLTGSFSAGSILAGISKIFGF